MTVPFGGGHKSNSSHARSNRSRVRSGVLKQYHALKQHCFVVLYQVA
jgi:hypothetical protein